MFVPMRSPILVPLALVTALTLTACGTSPSSSAPAGSAGEGAASASAPADAEGPVTIYSGRNEKLVGPLLATIEAETGVTVEVRYGESSALAAQLLEEGDRSPADLFFSQDAGALGALAAHDRLAVLPDATINAVLPGYADDTGHWVATSARARVVAYNPDLVPEAETMTTIDTILDPRYKGKVGFAPTNASFHSFVTALRVTKGEDGAKDWLTRFAANDPKAYDKNGAVLKAVDSGEIALGLINHYYWYELVNEQGADKVRARIRFLGSDDPGALINVAGAGILASSKRPAAAAKVLDHLLSPSAQTYFADTTAEYPVVEGITSTNDLPPLTELKGSSVDLNQLSSLDKTLALLGEVGLT